MAADELREFLQSRLAAYMVPAVFVLLETLPLNANGKVDRAALPEPRASESRGQRDYAPPTSPMETELARIWGEVLRLDRIGVRDNFFEFGGDSILCLQVVSRAQRAGIRITTRQLFQCQTIAELAAVAAASEEQTRVQGDVTGDIPLLPAQRWFFDLNLPQSGHWNQSVMLRVTSPMDWRALQDARAAVIARHEALRVRFVRDGTSWRQMLTPSDEAVPATRIDLSSIADTQRTSAIAKHAEELQKSLDLEHGPLLRVAWFDCGERQADHLLIIIHHLAVDGVSWRILLEDLQAAYGEALAGETISLPPPATSFAQWARLLVDRARSDSLKGEMSYWLSQEQMPAVPADWPDGVNSEQSAERVTVALTASETESLLREVGKAYHTRVDETLLTALAQTLAGWTGESRVAVELEGHGREASCRISTCRVRSVG